MDHEGASMELGTFGAILAFALDLEEQAVAFYVAAPEGRLAQAFGELARGSSKRLRRLERARRELVVEMVLEPITGLEGDPYRVDWDPQADEAGLLGQAVVFEEAAARFYGDAAAKMPVREVVRLFQRLARENEQRRAQLGTLEP
jgi:rubrerythrin